MNQQTCKHNSYGHDIQLLIVNCDIYGADITTVKYQRTSDQKKSKWEQFLILQ
jgi:hypothetical protein